MGEEDMDEEDMDEHVIFDGTAPAGWRWTHMQRSPEAEAALIEDPQIPEPLAYALVEKDTIPRATQVEGGTLLFLRGVNLRPGEEPEDMVSIRLWVSAARVVSTEVRRLAQTDDMIAEFAAGDAPATPGAFVLTLVERLRAAAEPVLDELEDRVAGMETAIARPERRFPRSERSRLAALRQDIILLHRYIAPQGVALEALARARPGWLAEPHALREEAEAFRRITADLDALRQRAQLVAEEITLVATERTNDIILTLSMVAVVFLPLTFLTGLLGVNLAGIPQAEEPWVFWAFCALLLGVGLFTLWLARRLMR